MIQTFSDLIPYYSWLYIPIVLLAVFSALKYRKNSFFFSSLREKVVSLIFGIFFVLFYSLGLCLSSGAFITWKSVGFILVACCLFSTAIGTVYHYINLYLLKQFSTTEESAYILSRHPLIFPFIVMMICWMPVFLALYPGLFAYDVAYQLNQTIGNCDTRHPLFHTYYLKFFYKLGEIIGSYNIGMGISVILQMVLFSLSLAYSIKYLISRHVKRAIVIIVLIFFSFVPAFPIIAVSMTKDVLFTAAFIASFIKILELNDVGFKSFEIGDWIQILLFFILTSLSRNNGQYAVFAVIAVFFIQSLNNRSNLKYAYVLVVSAVILITVSNNLLINVTKAAPGTKNQLLSLPYQQIARVYKFDSDIFSPHDKEIVSKLIPGIDYYNEHLSDPVMWGATVFDSSENKRLFFEIYIKYLLKKPVRYVEAFLINTIGYWYLDDLSDSQIYGRVSNDYVTLPNRDVQDPFGLFLMFTQPGYGVAHESKISWLDDVIKQLFHENKYQNIPIIAVIFSIGVYSWLFTMLCFYCLQKKNNKAIVPIVFVLSYGATLFAGPCVLFRYALPYICCIPAFMVTVYGDDRMLKKFVTQRANAIKCTR